MKKKKKKAAGVGKRTALTVLCVVLAVVLGFAAAVSPALKSASMDPQTAITRGEVN